MPTPVNAAFQFSPSMSFSMSQKITHWLIILYFLFGPITLTQDIPVHLNSAYILSDLLLSPQSMFHEWFEYNPGIFSNILLQWAAILPAAFLSPAILYRFTLLCMVLVLMGGFKSLLKQLGAEKNTFFILPFLFPVLFLKGFANFYLGVGCMLYMWAEILYALKNKPRNRLLLLSLITLTAHPFAFAAMIAGSLLLLAALWGDTWIATQKQRWQIFALNLPAILLFIVNKSDAYTLSFQGWPADLLWEILYTGQDWIWYHNAEKYLVLIPAGCILLLVVYSNVIQYNRYALLAASSCFALFTLYFFAPIGIEENLYIYPRVLFLAFLMLAATAALSHIPDKMHAPIKYICLIAPMALIVMRYDTQEIIDKQYQDIQNVSQNLPRGSVILPINHNPTAGLSPNASPFLHILHLTTLHQKILTLDHYAAHSQVFPIRWKIEKDPYLTLPPDWETQPQRLEPSTLKKIQADYIIELFPATPNPQFGTPEMLNATAIRYAFPKIHLDTVQP